MGMTPHEYYCMTRAEFILKLRGYQNANTEQWQHTRQICYTVAGSAFGRKKRLPSIKQWWPLPTDKIIPELNIEKMRSTWQILKGNE